MSSRYILERLSKNVKRRDTHIKSIHDESLLEPRSKRFDDLVFRSQNICEFASESKELTGILHCAYDNAMVEMQEYKPKRKRKCSLSHDDASLEDINEFQSSPQVRKRGRPKNRLGSNTEKQIPNVAKKKKKKALSEVKMMFFKQEKIEFVHLDICFERVWVYWGAGERKKSMCCNNFHIVIFSGCHLTTAVVFSPYPHGITTLPWIRMSCGNRVHNCTRALVGVEMQDNGSKELSVLTMEAEDLDICFERVWVYWGAGERKKSMCCNNFHIVIFFGCHLTTAVVFSPKMVHAKDEVEH
ncbi:hypothetical protein Ahy_A07g032873 [Arachis hypogaea]|uniref:Uncharacterized protein n=1 Tax=Arachis hypogaea TaxID=3818 RepID=A0A445C7V4_ARAHY|nr:hypothetical protein Ahy_A07g032873 [Arachis hypogaea]